MTIKGKGLNLAALDWINFGAPTQAASQQNPFLNLVSVTGTEIEVRGAGARHRDRRPDELPGHCPVRCRPVERGERDVCRHPDGLLVQATAGPTAGKPAAPDTGGTPIEIDGSGFANQTLAVTFFDVAGPLGRHAVQLHGGERYEAARRRRWPDSGGRRHPGVHRHRLLVAELVRQRPGRRASSSSRRAIRRSTPSRRAPGRRPAGLAVTITGENLGCVTNVSFGSVAAPKPRTPRRCSTAARPTRSP